MYYRRAWEKYCVTGRVYSELSSVNVWRSDCTKLHKWIYITNDTSSPFSVSHCVLMDSLCRQSENPTMAISFLSDQTIKLESPWGKCTIRRWLHVNEGQTGRKTTFLIWLSHTIIIIIVIINWPSHNQFPKWGIANKLFSFFEAVMLTSKWTIMNGDAVTFKLSDR